MSRNDAQALHSIRMMCRMQQINEKDLCTRSKLILSIYRDVCWTTMSRAADVYNNLSCTYSSNMDRALIYLETFAPDETRERFQEEIQNLFETRWLIRLVDVAINRIREYPCRGELYYEILVKCYLSRFKYKEAEILELMRMERSTYYDRKKEAVLLFGLSLWGNAIPMLKNLLITTQKDEKIG